MKKKRKKNRIVFWNLFICPIFLLWRSNVYRWLPATSYRFFFLSLSFLRMSDLYFDFLGSFLDGALNLKEKNCSFQSNLCVEALALMYKQKVKYHLISCTYHFSPSVSVYPFLVLSFSSAFEHSWCVDGGIILYRAFVTSFIRGNIFLLLLLIYHCVKGKSSFSCFIVYCFFFF